MPFNSLWKPRFTKAVNHLKAKNLVLIFHQIIKNCLLRVLKPSIKYMPLHNVLCILPDVHLSFLLKLHDISGDVVSFMLLFELNVIQITWIWLLNSLDPSILLMGVLHTHTPLKKCWFLKCVWYRSFYLSLQDIVRHLKYFISHYQYSRFNQGVRSCSSSRLIILCPSCPKLLKFCFNNLHLFVVSAISWGWRVL